MLLLTDSIPCRLVLSLDIFIYGNSVHSRKSEFPSLSEWSFDWLDLLQVLFGNPQLLWVDVCRGHVPLSWNCVPTVGKDRILWDD